MTCHICVNFNVIYALSSQPVKKEHQLLLSFESETSARTKDSYLEICKLAHDQGVKRRHFSTSFDGFCRSLSSPTLRCVRDAPKRLRIVKKAAVQIFFVLRHFFAPKAKTTLAFWLLLSHFSSGRFEGKAKFSPSKPQCWLDYYWHIMQFEKLALLLFFSWIKWFLWPILRQVS